MLKNYLPINASAHGGDVDQLIVLVSGVWTAVAVHRDRSPASTQHATYSMFANLPASVPFCCPHQTIST